MFPDTPAGMDVPDYQPMAPEQASTIDWESVGPLLAIGGALALLFLMD